jgi:tRNA G37 N-methylase Trm5
MLHLNPKDIPYTLNFLRPKGVIIYYNNKHKDNFREKEYFPQEGISS